MKTDHKPNDVDGLLDAVLVDAEWQALDSALKSKALAVLGATRRRRRLRLAMVQVTSVAALVLAAVWWLRSPDSNHGLVPQVARQSVAPDAGNVFISEDQMLAMFPSGSCAVAEIDGKKELVFFDAKKAHEGFVVDGR